MANPRLSTDNLCLLTNNLSTLNKFSSPTISKIAFRGENS